jgi:hypothetical protein
VQVPLADHLARHGRLDAAVRLMAGWVEGRKQATAEEYAGLAELYLRAGRLDEAERNAREALRRTPGLATAEKVLAEVARRRR